MNKDRTLILITVEYPYKKGETFIENEIPYLEKQFKKIIILCSVPFHKTERYIPKNSDVIFYSENILFFNKIVSFFYIFNDSFWKELRFIRKVLKQPVTFKKVKILLIDHFKAIRLKNKIKEIIQTGNLSPDTIYLYSYWNDFRAIAVSYTKKDIPTIKVFSRAHRWDVYFFANPEHYLPLKEVILEMNDAIFFISEDSKKHFEGILHPNEQKAQKLLISRLGIDNPFNRNLLSSVHPCFQLISCSMIHENKRVDLIAESLFLINSFCIEWHHFGEGLYSIDEIKFKNVVKKCLESKFNIKYNLHGHMNNKDIFQFYHTNPVNLFINTSKNEGIPVSIMEAMSFGIPVMATDVGGTSEILEHGYNGFLLPGNPTPQQICDSIISFIRLPENEINRIRDNAFNTWKNKYQANKNFSEFAKSIIRL